MLLQSPLHKDTKAIAEFLRREAGRIGTTVRRIDLPADTLEPLDSVAYCRCRLLGEEQTSRADGIKAANRLPQSPDTQTDDRCSGCLRFDRGDTEVLDRRMDIMRVRHPSMRPRAPRQPRR